MIASISVVLLWVNAPKAKAFLACVAALMVTAGVTKTARAYGAEAWYDPATGNIRLVLGPYHAVAGFEAFGSLQFNAAASGNLGTVAPAQKDAKILAYFSANLLPAGDYVISSILPAGLQGTPVGNELHLTQVGFSYSQVGDGSIIEPVKIQATPEPATSALAGMGLISIIGIRRRRKEQP